MLSSFQRPGLISRNGSVRTQDLQQPQLSFWQTRVASDCLPAGNSAGYGINLDLTEAIVLCVFQLNLLLTTWRSLILLPSLWSLRTCSWIVNEQYIPLYSYRTAAEERLLEHRSSGQPSATQERTDGIHWNSTQSCHPSQPLAPQEKLHHGSSNSAAHPKPNRTTSSG